MADDKYVCSLSETALQKARKELNEDPKERLGAVQTFREWVEREPWITSPTNTLFLLSFLRTAKFSQLKARERLENFIFQITNLKKFLFGHDPADPKSLDIVRDCIYLFLPERDKEGRRIILCRVGAFQTSRYSYHEFLVANVPLFHAVLFFNEEDQVHGLVFLVDYGGVTMSLMTWMGFDNLRQTADFMNKAFPARLKGLDYYNTGPVFETMMELFKPLLSKKLRERVHIHHTMVSVYEEIGMSVLPEEYLPDDYKGPSAGKMKDIIEQNIKDYLLEPVKREYLKDFYSGKYTADLTKKPKEMEATASFRKLNVS